MTANLGALRANVLDGLPCEISRKCFLWLAEHHDQSRMKYRAEALAQECAQLVRVLWPMLDAGRHDLDTERMTDLQRFILKRWVVYRLGPNSRAWWEVTP